ncbi:MAG: hypothetical protein ACRYG5_18105 [Janthinobacterium lividum]
MPEITMEIRLPDNTLVPGDHDRQRYGWGATISVLEMYDEPTHNIRFPALKSGWHFLEVLIASDLPSLHNAVEKVEKGHGWLDVMGVFVKAFDKRGDVAPVAECHMDWARLFHAKYTTVRGLTYGNPPALVLQFASPTKRYYGRPSCFNNYGRPAH